MKKISLSFFLFFLWATLVVGFFLVLGFLWLTLEEFTFQIYSYIRVHIFLGAFLFVILYVLRPLVFIPATPFNLLAWVLFGFFWGSIISTIANYFSVIFSYYVGYFTGGKIFENQSWFRRIKKFQKKLQKDTFFSVSLTRLLFFPFDLTNYLCGVFKIPIIPYILATVACIPGTIIFVLAWAAFYGEEITSFSELFQNINYQYLYISIFFFCMSLILTWYLQRKYKID